MADKTVRLVNRQTGSVVVVSKEKADDLAASYENLGLHPEADHEPGRRLLRKEFRASEKAPAKKATAKKSSSSKSDK